MGKIMYSLYQDQSELVNQTRQLMIKNKSVLMQSPTGSGKTAMATWIINSAKNKNMKVIFCVPRVELFNQTCETFEKNNIPHGYIAAKHPFNPYCKIYVGMVQTMARRLNKLPNADLLIVDETHFGSGQLDTIIEHYKKQGAHILGLSATPWKSSGKGLGCWYDAMSIGKSVEWLIENKRLSDYKAFAPSTLDLSGLKVTAGDYAKGELSEFMEGQRVIVGDAVKYYRETAMGRLHIVFCTSIKHSQIVCATFNRAGITAVHVDGEMPKDQLKQIIKAYARREILVLTFCDLLCFGFDLAQASGMDVTIESMSDLKPTKSLSLQLQKWGRVLRYKDYPALIFDHANNFKEHGFPCSKREWTLKDRKQGKRESEPAPASRTCPTCFLVHTPAPICPECKHVYEIKGREIDEVEGELQEIDKVEARKQARIEQGQAQSLEELIELGKKRNYKSPTAWASKVMAGRMMKRGG